MLFHLLMLYHLIDLYVICSFETPNYVFHCFVAYAKD
jgi:hypothetical protein